MKVLLALALIGCGGYAVFGAFVGTFFTGAMTLGAPGKLFSKTNVIGGVGVLMFVSGVIWLLTILF